MEAVAGWILAVTAVLLSVAVVSTRRPAESAGSQPPGFSAHLARWSDLHGDLDPNADSLVRRWLRFVHRLARWPARAGLAPDVLSLTAVWLAGAAATTGVAGGRWPLLGAAAVAATGVVDGLDGAVAILAGKVTRRGRIVDSVCDRVADGLLLAGFVALGGSGWVALAAAVAILGLETTRAAGLRRGRMGRLTPGERPTRLVLAGLGMIVAGCVPGEAGWVATVASAVTAVVVGGSCAVLAVDLGFRSTRLVR